MQLLGAFMVISILAFSAFCFYCGICSIIEKLKKDGLLEVIKTAVIIFLVTTFVLVGVGRVRSLFAADATFLSIQRV
jgi:hypothetical protein